MPLPLKTPRRWMMAVAAAVLVPGGVYGINESDRRSDIFQKNADYHRQRQEDWTARRSISNGLAALTGRETPTWLSAFYTRKAITGKPGIGGSGTGGPLPIRTSSRPVASEAAQLPPPQVSAGAPRRDDRTGVPGQSHTERRESRSNASPITSCRRAKLLDRHRLVS